MRKRNWLAIGAFMFALTMIAAFRESLSGNGIAAVATALDTLGVVMFFILGTAIIIAAIFRRSQRRWPTFMVASLTALMVAMALGGVYSFYRGHTAADRFEDRIAEFTLPSGYTPDESIDVEPGTLETQHVYRAWNASGANVCDDLETAFRDWAEEPISSYERGGNCEFVSTGQPEKAHLSTEDDGTVILEMYMTKTQLFVL